MTADYRQLIALRVRAHDLHTMANDVAAQLGDDYAARELTRTTERLEWVVSVIEAMARMPETQRRGIVVGEDNDRQHD